MSSGDSATVVDRAVLIDAAKATMEREGGRLAAWHSWRCEYPDRYGECDCNREVADEILRSVLPLIADAIEGETLAVNTRYVGTTEAAHGWVDGHASAAALVRSFTQGTE